MGTNFYWKPNAEGKLPGGLGMAERYDFDDPEEGWDKDSPRMHIGKRSAAGLYCWDCGCPLVSPRHFQYPRRIWTGHGIHGGGERIDYCPECHSRRDPDNKPDMDTPGNPVGVELGFAKPLDKRPTGVDGASSFSWAQEPARALQILLQWPDEPLVQDEYGRDLTCKEFMAMVMLCPLWLTDSVGTAFS